MSQLTLAVGHGARRDGAFDVLIGTDGSLESLAAIDRELLVDDIPAPSELRRTA